MASAQVTVAGTSLTTDGNGLVEATVDKSAKDATLLDAVRQRGRSLARRPQSVRRHERRRVQGAALQHGIPLGPSVDDTDDEMVIALQDFQAQYSLTVSGQLDDATKAQLVQTYGC